MPETVCKTCNDTHTMTMHFGFDEREVMCTHCPTPCQLCRAGGNGPYCEHTPCSCACHAPRPECACGLLVGASGKVIGRTINPRCPVHGVNAPPMRSPNEIADDLRLECMSWRADGWRARMTALCEEWLRREGRDGSG